MSSPRSLSPSIRVICSFFDSLRLELNGSVCNMHVHQLGTIQAYIYRHFPEYFSEIRMNSRISIIFVNFSNIRWHIIDFKLFSAIINGYIKIHLFRNPRKMYIFHILLPDIPNLLEQTAFFFLLSTSLQPQEPSNNIQMQFASFLSAFVRSIYATDAMCATFLMESLFVTISRTHTHTQYTAAIIRCHREEVEDLC